MGETIEEALVRAMREHDLVVAVMAVGIVVRSICPALRDKWSDTPVVAVDSALRSAVPVIGGHHGANRLALFLHRRLGLYPAITTATEAEGRPNVEGMAKRLGCYLENVDSSKGVNMAFLRDEVPLMRIEGPKVVIVDEDVAVLKGNGGLVVGLGANRGVLADEVMEAILSALREVGRGPTDIRVLASAWIKEDEPGIREAARRLDRQVVFLSSEVLNSQDPPSPSRASDLGLKGVAEPAALALSKRLIMKKRIYGRVTVALGE